MPVITRYVKEIKKRENVIIRISKRTYKGYEYAEIRQFIRDRRGEYQPTKKGFTFPPKILDEFIEGLTALKELFPELSA